MSSTVNPGGYWYPIVNPVPVLMDHSIALHEDFKNNYKERSVGIRDRKQPDKAPRPGEDSNSASLLGEWNTLAVHDLSFGPDPNQRDQFITTELEWDRDATDTPPLVFEAGCGSGFEARSLDRVTKGYIFGIDMNLIVRRDNRNQSVSQILLSLPFSSFLYGQRHLTLLIQSGVLHHT
jgi:hypothetical protein